MRNAAIIAGVFLAFFLLVCTGCIGILEVPFYLVFGWIAFLRDTLPQVAVEPAALAVGGVALVLFTILLHFLARWFYSQSAAGEEPPRKWRLRWSLTVAGIVVFAFSAGIGMVALVHEVKWLLSSDEEAMRVPGFAMGRYRSVNNLKQIGVAMHNYHTAADHFPPGGTFGKHGEMGHSWETYLLPYLESPAKPDLNLPWDHPDNARHFKTQVEVFLYPRVRRNQLADEQGYALSHYAANNRVFCDNSRIQIRDVRDGTSNTIMAGEVRENFKPWGHPINWRDPALGINQSPHGFGSPWRGGAQFLLMDGSTRFISENVDPATLKALSTPAGGEEVGSF